MAWGPGRCQQCGTSLPAAARFCSHCGARAGPQPRGLTVLAVLSGAALALVAVLLGGLGACFVITGVSALSQGASGLVWALLCWFVAALAFVGMMKVLR